MLGSNSAVAILTIALALLLCSTEAELSCRPSPLGFEIPGALELLKDASCFPYLSLGPVTRQIELA